jgi:hypothetical membrane protein
LYEVVMRAVQRQERLVLISLGLGVVVPFLYFGIQVVAAPFYPGYSFLNRDASTLGSDGSSCPAIFNVGAIFVGLLTLIASWGFLCALHRLGVNPILTWLVVLALISSGLASINAGVFPLPDPRHSGGFFALLGIGTILLPILLPVAMWKLQGARLLRVFFIVNSLAILALIPIVSGFVQFISIKAGLELQNYQTFLNNYHGLIQRMTALVVFLPLGAGAYFLAGRMISSVRETVAP